MSFKFQYQICRNQWINNRVVIIWMKTIILQWIIANVTTHNIQVSLAITFLFRGGSYFLWCAYRYCYVKEIHGYWCNHHYFIFTQYAPSTHKSKNTNKHTSLRYKLYYRTLRNKRLIKECVFHFRNALETNLMSVQCDTFPVPLVVKFPFKSKWSSSCTNTGDIRGFLFNWRRAVEVRWFCVNLYAKIWFLMHLICCTLFQII